MPSPMVVTDVKRTAVSAIASTAMRFRILPTEKLRRARVFSIFFVSFISVPPCYDTYDSRTMSQERYTKVTFLCLYRLRANRSREKS